MNAMANDFKEKYVKIRDEKLELSNFFCGYLKCSELIIEN